MTKRQEFQLREKHADFEIREYLPCVTAQVKVSAPYSVATNLAFNSLFKFISKGNSASEKIAMTAPVIATQKEIKSDPDEWVVSFVMPAGSAMKEMPQPTDSRVVLHELAPQTCAVLSFRGKATAEKSNEKERELRQAAAKAGIALSDETRICRFDPPFNPAFLQYNEIVIPLI